MNKQKGFTAIELVVCLVAVLGIGIMGTIAYVAIHFISKFW